MALDTASAPELQTRVEQLEKQVSALTTMMTVLHQKMHLHNLGVPKPDLFMQSVQNTQKAAPTPVQTTSATKPIATIYATKSPIDLTKLSSFRYTPLNVTTSEVRLIKILESQAPDAPIECEVIVRSLPETLHRGDFPMFMPLSYTWGTLDKTETIVMNGKSFLVTKNLHVALKHFRSATPTSLVPTGWPVSIHKRLHWWVDAVCINQDDLDERKSQVALMTRLYRMGLVTHVWLGEEAEDSSRAMDLIKNLSHEPNDKAQIEFVQRKPGQTHWHKGPGTIPEKIPDEPAPFQDDEKTRNYLALIQLFKRGWFSRAWILQEVALPMNISVHCGDQTCSWAQLSRATSLLVYLADEYQLARLHQPGVVDSNAVSSIFQRTELLARLRDMARRARESGGTRRDSSSPYLSLTTALVYARNSRATDLRDKVFAILPLVSPEMTQLTADYRKPHVEVYIATAVDLAATSLNFLSACQYTEGASSLPSWVPDFSKSWKYYPMLATLSPKSLTVDEDPPGAIYQSSSASLQVQGYILDTISRVQDLGVTAASSKTDVQAVKDDWQAFVTKHDVDRQTRDLEDNLRWYSSGSSMYWPLYNTAYVGGKGEEYDLSIRSFNRYIVPNPEAVKLNPHEKLGWYRNFFTGRKFAATQQRHVGVVPAAAKSGDKICKLKGSDLIFILRESSEKRWLVIGDSYFLSNYSGYQIAHMRPMPKFQDILLI